MLFCTLFGLGARTSPESIRAGPDSSTAEPRPAALTTRSRCRPASTQARWWPGDVLALDPRHPHDVRLSSEPDSPLLAGVYSTKPSVLAIGNHRIGDSLAGTVPVAMLGIVPTKVSAENGPVRPGDLLTTASTPGYAMKATPVIVSGVRRGCERDEESEVSRRGSHPEVSDRIISWHSFLLR